MKKTLLIGFLSLVVSIVVVVFGITFMYEQLNRLLSTPVSGQTSDSAADSSDRPVSGRPVVNAGTQTDINAPLAMIHEGDFELPLNGSTGFASIKLNLTAEADSRSEILQALEPGAGFTILQEQGDWWEVAVGGETGWLPHQHCMINLPDVIPSIVYDSTNTYNSQFLSSGEAIPNITGESLYPGKVQNDRLGKREYISAVLYSMAKKIHEAQQLALADGESLIMYEGFRPFAVQRMVVNELTALANSNSKVSNGINSDPWSLSWFISTSVSNHQRGYAMDVSLVRPTATEYAVTGGRSYLQIIKFIEREMPTKIHELSIASVVFTYPVQVNSHTAWKNAPLVKTMKENESALNLQKYCTEAGLTPLASEWWHFNDLYTMNSISRPSGGDFILTECFSLPPE